MHLGMGVMQYIRNRFAHESGTTSEAKDLEHVEALHYLVTLSTYAQIIDTAKVTTPKTKTRSARPPLQR